MPAITESLSSDRESRKLDDIAEVSEELTGGMERGFALSSMADLRREYLAQTEEDTSVFMRALSYSTKKVLESSDLVDRGLSYEPEFMDIARFTLETGFAKRLEFTISDLQYILKRATELVPGHKTFYRVDPYGWLDGESNSEPSVNRYTNAIGHSRIELKTTKDRLRVKSYGLAENRTPNPPSADMRSALPLHHQAVGVERPVKIITVKRMVSVGMAQRRIELRTLRKAHCELHRNAECDTITPLNRSRLSPIFLLKGQKKVKARQRFELRSLHYFSFPPATRTECVTTTPPDHVCEQYKGPVRGARKKEWKRGMARRRIELRTSCKEVLVQEPWQDALQLRHRVANTKWPERMERGLRVIKKVGNTGKGLDRGSNSGLSDTECVSTTLSSRRRRKPDRRQVRTGHGVSETRANKSGLRNRCLTKDGAGKGSRSSRMSHKRTLGRRSVRANRYGTQRNNSGTVLG
ncbi:hypothetical protein FB451DRAFT_1163171 [Mycena latifolia]|nr:hypothetical protein FB451DRAFT_1163171 [Mycena latifolia]